MKKKFLGAREKVCDRCGGTMVFLKVKSVGTISQCIECSNCVSGRAKDEVKIYAYDFEEVK